MRTDYTQEFMSKSLSDDDFRSIAISPIISEIFEYCFFLDRFGSILSSLDNQFGFKKDSCCRNAIYTFRIRSSTGYDSYVTRGTTTNICSIDLSKAFDKVNHYALFAKLSKRLFCVQLLDIIYI